MVVCHNLKCIFVHIPRCAGSSINRWLFTSGSITEKKQKDYEFPNTHIMYGNLYTREGVYELDHSTPEMFIKFVDQRYLDSYFKFTFVRNPWDRLLSEYFRKKVHNDIRFIDTSQIDFTDYIKILYEKFDEVLYSSQSHETISHFIPQYKFVFDSSGQQFVDFIGKFENLVYDLKIVASKIGLMSVQLGKSHSTVHSSYVEYYNKKTINLVEQMYEQDIQTFDYTFEAK